MRQPREGVAANKKRRAAAAAAVRGGGAGGAEGVRLGCCSEQIFAVLLVCTFKDERKGVSTHRNLPVGYLFHQTNGPGIESRAIAMSGGRGVMKEMWVAPRNLWLPTTTFNYYTSSRRNSDRCLQSPQACPAEHTHAPGRALGVLIWHRCGHLTTKIDMWVCSIVCCVIPGGFGPLTAPGFASLSFADLAARASACGSREAFPHAGWQLILDKKCYHKQQSLENTCV